jgi:serine/threonine-protein kinase
MNTLESAGIDGDEGATPSARAVGLPPSSRRGYGSWRAPARSVLASPAEGTFRMALQPGNQLDRYTIEAVIGEGGMGRVCRAYDTRLQRRVAIKVLHLAEGAEAADNVASALREARAAAAIAHPNATAVYDADTLAGVPFIVMEFVPGTSLRQIISGSPVPMMLRLRWLVDIAGALTAAHHVGIVHRDIKPENVMVRDDGLVKVLDFGVARRARLARSDSHPSEQLSTPDGGGRLVGTPAYMPPEQIRGEPTDGRADQFAWGVLAYELLTGRLPWKTAREFLGYIAAVLTERPEPPRTHAPEIPPQVEAAILRALAKNPANRFPNIGAAAAELAPFAQDVHGAHGPTMMPPQPQPQPSPLPARSPSVPVIASPPPPPPSSSSLASSSPLAFELPPSRPSRPSPSPSVAPRPPRPSAPTTMPSVSLRRTLEGHKLREPRFDVAVDLDAHLALLPSGAVCKGMFFIDTLKLGTRAAPAGDLMRAAQISDRRHMPFHDYPAAEYTRLLVTVARAVYPKLPLGEGLRRIGQTAFDTVLGTHIGRSFFGILGPDVEKVFLAGPKAMQLLVNFGRFTCEKGGAHTFVLRARDYPAFLETYQMGVIEGALRHCRATGRIRIELEDLSSALVEVRVG